MRKKDLIQRISDGETFDYLFFWKTLNGKRHPLTQWFLSDFIYGATTFKSAEQFMMYQKAVKFKDWETAKKIMATGNPFDAMKLGRQVSGFNQSEWDNGKEKVVMAGNCLKFTQNEHLKNYLLSTDDTVIVEASPADCIWGIGLSESDNNAHNLLKWRGDNLLGFILMDVRDKLKEQEALA